MDFGIASVAGITVICYLAGMGMKASEKVKNEVIPVPECLSCRIFQPRT